jgi:hypothetical protein
MNVTVKIDDHLCREARHQAVDRGLSLSAWIAEMMRRELSGPAPEEEGLLDALAIKEGSEKEFVVERDSAPARSAQF